MKRLHLMFIRLRKYKNTMENKSKKETGVVFILMCPNGELLLQLRDDSSPQYPDTWVFPGGGERR